MIAERLLGVSAVTMNVDSGVISARLGHDLPSVACQAAIELDTLLLGRTKDLPSVAELSRRLSEEVPPVLDLNSPLSLVDPSTVVALHGTIEESRLAAPSDDIIVLTQDAGEIVRRLKAVSDDPAAARASDLEELRKLKEFCLILSR